MNYFEEELEEDIVQGGNLTDHANNFVPKKFRRN